MKAVVLLAAAIGLPGLVYFGLTPVCACGPQIPAYQVWIEDIADVAGWKIRFERPGLQ
jgi:hypothetical protein